MTTAAYSYVCKGAVTTAAYSYVYKFLIFLNHALHTLSGEYSPLSDNTLVDEWSRREGDAGESRVADEGPC